MRAHLVVKKTLQALLAVVARPINEPQAASAERRDQMRRRPPNAHQRRESMPLQVRLYRFVCLGFGQDFAPDRVVILRLAAVTLANALQHGECKQHIVVTCWMLTTSGSGSLGVCVSKLRLIALVRHPLLPL